VSIPIRGNETLLKIIKEYTEPGTTVIGGWESVVSIVTTNMLDSPWFEHWWGRDQPRGPPSLLYSEYQLFARGKAAGAWHWPLTPI
jgi:hypothetical protein